VRKSARKKKRFALKENVRLEEKRKQEEEKQGSSKK
jgi:hypothetical protein